MSQDLSPVGKWKTIDDETGEPKSIIEIWEENGMLYGRIEFLFLEPDEDPNPLCDKCTGELKDQPVLGMVILKDLKQSGQQWKGGTILDPDNGKTYKCKIEVIEEGKRLKVRGFIGVSLLGRTQYWEKVE
ncbi:DUF2147 domain-containing protein [Candidatus Cloacimonadota bacterium]